MKLRFSDLCARHSIGSHTVDRLPVSEKSPLHPVSIYGYLKACADLYALNGAKSRPISVCVLRFSNLYGASVGGSFPSTVLQCFAGGVLRGGSVILHASLKNSRDFLHVKDAARALEAAVLRKQVEGIVNVGSGKETSLREAAERLARLAGKELAIDFRPKEGRLRRMSADIRRARQVFGFIPKVPLDQGLREVLDGVWHEIKRQNGPKEEAKNH